MRQRSWKASSSCRSTAYTHTHTARACPAARAAARLRRNPRCRPERSTAPWTPFRPIATPTLMRMHRLTGDHSAANQRIAVLVAGVLLGHNGIGSVPKLAGDGVVQCEVLRGAALGARCRSAVQAWAGGLPSLESCRSGTQTRWDGEGMEVFGCSDSDSTAGTGDRSARSAPASTGASPVIAPSRAGPSCRTGGLLRFVSQAPWLASIAASQAHPVRQGLHVGADRQQALLQLQQEGTVEGHEGRPCSTGRQELQCC